MNAIAQARLRQQEAQGNEQLSGAITQLGKSGMLGPDIAAEGAAAALTGNKEKLGDLVGVQARRWMTDPDPNKRMQGLALADPQGFLQHASQQGSNLTGAAFSGNEAAEQQLGGNPHATGFEGTPGQQDLLAATTGVKTSQEQKNTAQAHAAAQSGQGLTDDAAYAAAVRYNNTGVMPPMGMGNGPARAKILQMGAMLQTDPNWHPTSFDAQPGTPHPTAESAASTAGNQADFTANKSSLTTLSRTTAQIDASAQTVQKQFGLVRAAIAKAGQTGSPAANWVENATRQNLLGSGDVSSYKNALTTARTEYARVISMATGATGITDEGRRQGESLFPDNLSPEQFEKNAAIAQKEMDARTSSQHEQMESLRTKLHGTPPAVGGAAPKPGANAPTLSPEDQAMLKRLSGGG